MAPFGPIDEVAAGLEPFARLGQRFLGPEISVVTELSLAGITLTGAP